MKVGKEGVMGFFRDLLKELAAEVTGERRRNWVAAYGDEYCHYCGREATGTWTYRDVSCPICGDCKEKLLSER